MNMAPRTVQRMSNYFSRHQKDRRPGWGNPGNPSNGYIAWLLWGGDAGRAWAGKILREMKKKNARK